MSESAPSAPDYSPIINSMSSLEGQAQGLAGQQENWAQGQYATDQGVSQPIVQNQSSQMTGQEQFGQGIQNQYQSTYEPLENQFANEASNYTSQDNINNQMGRAEATAAQTGQAALNNTQQQLKSYGINPASGAYAGQTTAANTANAASIAGAGNQAYQATEQTGLGLQAQAIGQGQQGEALGQAAESTGIQAGTNALGNELATTASGANTMGTAQGFESAATGAGSAATNALNSEYSNELAQFQANMQASPWGALAGIGAGLLAAPGSSTIGKLLAKRGGAIPDDNSDIKDDGGYMRPSLSPTHGAVTDDIPAQAGKQAVQLNAGEYVIPKDVTAYFGHKHLAKMIREARTAMGESQQPIGPQRKAVPA